MEDQNASFDIQLKRLEYIIEELDKAELSLETMLKLYEEGMELTNSLRKYLDEAESKVIEISGKSSNSKGKLTELN